MANEDLSRLKIDKTGLAGRRPRRKKPLFWVVVALLAVIVSILAMKGAFTPRVEVELATVSQVYPSQGFTLLNASGYVVAQRKAAVASKATGRLEWLGVEEGSRVQEGQILARLENRDAIATRDQAAANLNNAMAGVEQSKAELQDATLAFNRQKELLGQGIVARADYDVAEARYRRAKAAVNGLEALLVSSKAALRAPTTSGKDERFEVSTGVPHAIASSGGRPKPS